MKIERPQKSEMCPVGSHIVKGHFRVCQSGTKTWIDTHRRKNRGKKFIYLSENLLYLYWMTKKSYKKINAIKPFKGYHEFDSIIQFWLEFWNSRFKNLPKIDPLLIKALIAKESSFNPKADPQVSHSSAYGLMQIVDKTRKALAGHIKSSVTKEYIAVERKDLEDPVINIAVGIRWLILKYYNVQKKKGNKLHNAIKAYYGSKNEKENNEYFQKILNYYNSSL